MSRYRGTGFTCGHIPTNEDLSHSLHLPINLRHPLLEDTPPLDRFSVSPERFSVLCDTILYAIVNDRKYFGCSRDVVPEGTLVYEVIIIKEKLHFFFASKELSNSVNTSMLTGFLSELIEPLYDDWESELSGPLRCTCHIKS
jgi:hypothetical protein